MGNFGGGLLLFWKKRMNKIPILPSEFIHTLEKRCIKKQIEFMKNKVEVTYLIGFGYHNVI